MAIRCEVVHHRDVAHDLHPGGVHRHQHQAVVVVRLCRSPFVARHHDQQAAVRMRRASDEPLAAVEHQHIPLLAHGGLQIGRVRRGHIGFAHGKGRADVTPQQRHEPLRALGGIGKAVQQFHVAAVGRIAIEDFGRPG